MAKKLYVGNLSFDTTESDLEALFAQHGEVQSCKLITDRETGRSKGFAFIEMENADQAMQELNGKEVDGRALKVNEAQDKPRISGGGGYGGGRRNSW